jgi:hypothetical protein
MAANDRLRDSANPLRELFDAAVRGYSVRLTCRHCSRIRRFDAHALWYLFERRRWDGRLAEVPRHFRCATCSGKSPVVELVREEPDDDTLPMPPRQAWRRELGRRR